MTNKKLTNRQAIGVLDGLWSNPLFGEAHRQAFEIGIKAIKALEQEPCEDAISRQATIVQLSHNKNGDDDCDVIIQKDIETVKALPPVNTQAKTGRWWERDTYPQESRSWDCSECQEIVFEKTNYCPNCGAKMQEVDNGDK